MLVTSVSPAAHMHRRAARGDVAVALLRVGSIAVALLHAASIAVALLHGARALSVQKRYANEWDVQKRHGSEQGDGPCGARGVSAASGTAQRGERLSETRRIDSEKRPRAGTRGRLGSACGGTTLRVETRARGRTASWTTCGDTTARRF